jgi:hypothetical protein
VETTIINVSGCVVIGLLAGLSETRGIFTGSTRAFLFIGVLGGYTTFSTFGYETFQLLRDAQWPRPRRPWRSRSGSGSAACGRATRSRACGVGR